MLAIKFLIRAAMTSLVIFEQTHATKVNVDAKAFERDVLKRKADFKFLLQNLGQLLSSVDFIQSWGHDTRASDRGEPMLQRLVRDLSEGAKIANGITKTQLGTSALLKRIEEQARDVLTVKVAAKPTLWVGNESRPVETSVWGILRDLFEYVKRETVDWSIDLEVALWLFDGERKDKYTYSLSPDILEDRVRVMKAIGKALGKIKENIKLDVQQYTQFLMSIVKINNPGARKNPLLTISANGSYGFYLSDEYKRVVTVVSREANEVIDLLDEFSRLSNTFGDDMEVFRNLVRPNDYEIANLNLEDILAEIQDMPPGEY